MPLSITHDVNMQELHQALTVLRQSWVPQNPLSSPRTGVEDVDFLDLSLDHHHLGEDVMGCGSSSGTAAAHHAILETKAKCGMIYLFITNLNINWFDIEYKHTVGDYSGSGQWLNISNPSA